MLNMVALNGRLTADPETRASNSGTTITNFTLAVDRNFVKQGEQRQADFIEIVALGKTGDFAGKYYKKGQLVAVAGELNTSSYTDKQGVKRKSVRVVAQHLYFAESKHDGNGNQAPAANNTNTGNRAASTNGNASPAAYSGSDNSDFVEIDGDDDLPF